jgi:O-antigen/teichoic acid export membrane protein
MHLEKQKTGIPKYKNISLPAKASLWFIICSLLQKGVSFITTPLFTRMISTSEYGEAVLYSSWMEIITIFATFQLATGVFNKAMIRYEDDRDGYTSSGLFLTTCITAVFFILYLLGANFWDTLFDLPRGMMCMMFLDIMFSTAMSFWSIRNRFEYRYKSVVVISLSVTILGSLLSLLLVHFSNTALQAEAKIVGMLLIKIVFYSVVYIVILRKGKKLVVPSYWKYSILYNLPLIPHYLSQQVLTQSDRIMISNICGKGDAAIYSVAYQLSMVAFLFTYAIHTSFTPWTYEQLKAKNYKNIGRKSLWIEILIGIMCFLFSLLAPELIYILGGKVYSSAVWIVPSVSMSVLFQTIYTFFGNVEFYFEKTGFVMVASIICAICNLILNACFIPNYGFVAAGYTTLICYILYAFVHYLFMKKIQKEQQIESIYNGKYMWLIAMIFVLMSIFVSFLYTHTWLRFCVIFVLGIITVSVLVFKRDVIKSLVK